jgi:hypothetical protein
MIGGSIRARLKMAFRVLIGVFRGFSAKAHDHPSHRSSLCGSDEKKPHFSIGTLTSLSNPAMGTSSLILF